MKAVESKSESEGGQDSQIMSENSKFLEENVEGFQQCVKEMMNLTTLVTELSRMHEALADQNVHLIKELSKYTDKSIKTQHVGSSASVSYECTLDTSEGGFQISTKEGSESSMSINKPSISPIKNDASKVHDPEALLKKISSLEKEVFGLKKKIQNLTNENALLEAEKSKVAELKHTVTESNRKIETTGKALEVYKEQVATAEDEKRKLNNDLSRKMAYQAQLVSKLETTEKTIVLMNEQSDAQKARESKLLDQVNSSLADVSKRDEQIKDLNTQIKVLKSIHAAEGNKWNFDLERLKRELKEKSELVDDLNHKHDALLKVVDRQGEVASDDAV